MQFVCTAERSLLCELILLMLIRKFVGHFNVMSIITRALLLQQIQGQGWL